MANIITAGNSTNGGTAVSSDTSGTLNIVTGSGSGANAITIDASQNVGVTGSLGVGTTSIGSGTKLEIRSANTIADARGIVAINSTNAAAANVGGSLSFGGETGQATTPFVFGSIAGRYEGSTYAGYLQFCTTSAPSGSILERMRLDSNGRLYINTTAAVGSLPAYETIVGNANSISLITLQDTGTTYGSGTQYITFANSSSTVAGSVQHNAAGTVNFATSSDFRLKENIVDSSNALTVVDAIKVRAFDWKEDNGHVDFGFIAQELQQHYPDAVCAGDNNAELTDPKGTWQVDYGKLTPLLLKAIQELKAELDALKAKVGE